MKARKWEMVGPTRRNERKKMGRKVRKWQMVALFNYNRLFSVHHTRKEARNHGGEIFIGGFPAYLKAEKEGSMRIQKVEVRELRRKK